jgi:hypothetical protein
VDVDGETVIEDCGASGIVKGTKVTVEIDGIGALLGFAKELASMPGRAYDGLPYAGWFDADALRSLLRAAPSTTVAGLAKTFKVPALLDDHTPAIKRDPTDLIAALVACAPPPPPLKPLGGWDRTVRGEVTIGDATLPAIVEVRATAVASEGSGDGDVTCAGIIVNRTRALVSASGSWASRRAYLYVGGWRLLLSDALSAARFTITVAVTCPFVPVVSDGKSPDLAPFVDLIGEAAAPALKAARASIKKRKNWLSIVDAAARVLPDALDRATDGRRLPAMVRQIYYAARPALLQLTGNESIGYDWFSGKVLPRHRDGNPELARYDILYDERGHFVEPHVGTLHGLSTLGVRQYLAATPDDADSLAMPSDLYPTTAGDGRRYGAVLIVEKTGFDDILAAAKVAERFDVAIISNKGMPVIAMRRLIDEIATRQPDTRFFALTDFDDAGVSIGNALTRDREFRYSFRNEIVVERIAVTFEQALDLHAAGLSEPYKPRQIDHLVEIGTDDEVIDFLRERRVELNAFTSRQLVDVIEGALAGLAKVIPGPRTLADAYRRISVNAQIEREVARLRQTTTPGAVPDDLGAAVGRLLSAQPILSWDQAVAMIARNEGR